MVCELKKLVPEDAEEEYFFLASKEETPPDLPRNDGISHSIFGAGR